MIGKNKELEIWLKGAKIHYYLKSLGPKYKRGIKKNSGYFIKLLGLHGGVVVSVLASKAPGSSPCCGT